MCFAAGGEQVAAKPPGSGVQGLVLLPGMSVGWLLHASVQPPSPDLSTGRIAAGGSALLHPRGRAWRGAGQADLKAVLVTACGTNTASMAHQRLAHADDAALRKAALSVNFVLD